MGGTFEAIRIRTPDERRGRFCRSWIIVFVNGYCGTDFAVVWRIRLSMNTALLVLLRSNKVQSERSLRGLLLFHEKGYIGYAG